MRKSAHITPAAAALLSAVCFSIYAQDAAPEDAAALQEQPKSKWTFSVAGGYDVRSGNTESEAFNGHAESYLDSEIINFRWTMDGAYAEQTNEQDDGTKTDERTAGNIKSTISLKYLLEEFFIYFDASGLNDAQADVRYRFMESTGIGRYLWKSDEFSFSLQTGLSYRQEKLSDGRDDYLGLRIAERIDWTPDFAEGVSFYQSGETTLAFKSGSSSLLSAECGVDVPLFASFSVVFKAVYNYDSDPADGKCSADRQYLTQLSYRF